MKKGTLAINIIIIAAICLIVLVIMVAIFGSNMRIWGTGIQECGVRGGDCASSCGDDETKITNTDCDSSNQVCCVKIFET